MGRGPEWSTWSRMIRMGWRGGLLVGGGLLSSRPHRHDCMCVWGCASYFTARGKDYWTMWCPDPIWAGRKWWRFMDMLAIISMNTGSQCWAWVWTVCSSSQPVEQTHVLVGKMVSDCPVSMDTQLDNAWWGMSRARYLESKSPNPAHSPSTENPLHYWGGLRYQVYHSTPLSFAWGLFTLCVCQLVLVASVIGFNFGGGPAEWIISSGRDWLNSSGPTVSFDCSDNSLLLIGLDITSTCAFK